MTNFVRTISLHLCLLPLFAVSSMAETSTGSLTRIGSQETPSIRSFLNFDPSQASFSKSLDPVIRPITAAVRILSNEAQPVAGQAATISKVAKAHLENAIAQAKILESKENRGLKDEIAFLQGYAYEELGEEEKALDYYKKSLELRAGNPLVMFRQGLVLKKLNRCNDALAKFKEVRWLTTDYEQEVLYTTAQCLDALQRGAEATAILQEISQKHPDYAPAARMLLERNMLSFDASGKRLDRAFAAKLEKDLSSLIAENPGDGQAALMLAKVLVRKSDPLVSMDDIIRGQSIAEKLANQSDFHDDQAVRVIFDAQMKRGDTPSAERTVTRGLAQNPESKLLLDAARQLEILKEGRI